MPSTTRLDEHGYGLCGTCRKNFFISQLDTCAYCDKWICPTHKKRINGLPACPSCYAFIKKSK